MAASVELKRATWPLTMISLAPVGTPALCTISIATQLTGKSILGKSVSGSTGIRVPPNPALSSPCQTTCLYS